MTSDILTWMFECVFTQFSPTVWKKNVKLELDITQRYLTFIENIISAPWSVKRVLLLTSSHRRCCRCSMRKSCSFILKVWEAEVIYHTG